VSLQPLPPCSPYWVSVDVSSAIAFISPCPPSAGIDEVDRGLAGVAPATGNGDLRTRGRQADRGRPTSIQAARLLRDLEETDDGPLWTQDLYGRHLRYLGPVHGYAGNMIALMRGWEWLTDDQRARIAEAVPRYPDGKRVAFRPRCIMAWRCGRSRQTSRGPRQLQQRPRAALPALSRSSRDGDGIRGCAVHVG
jgi:hypothetical protein